VAPHSSELNFDGLKHDFGFGVRFHGPFATPLRVEIAKGNDEWEIVGPPEIRDVDPNARYFAPFRAAPHAEGMRIFEQPPQINPHLECPPMIDAFECFLVALLFLRRYVTYCARPQRYARMQGAALLLGETGQV